MAIRTTEWYCSLLKTQKEIERDVNTLGGNTLGLLRKVRNFVLFRIHGCVIQQSLNENIFFVLYCFRKSFQWYQSKPQLIWIVIHISMCAEIYFLYVMIDIFDILIVFYLFGEVENNKNLCRDLYMWYVDCLVPICFRYSWLYLIYMLLKWHVSCI